MDLEIYFQYIKNNEFEKAQKYKNSFIPNKLYKYYSLDDRKEVNEKKLSCLEENKIFLSDFNSFNDPFEGRYFMFDYKKLQEYGLQKENVQDILSALQKNLKVSCFTNTNEQNMPMWAYYANNHQGYCVEYELDEEQKKLIFPVLYENERRSGDWTIVSLLDSVRNIKDKDKIKDDGFYFYLQILVLANTVKHSSWFHEKEFRIMSPLDNFFYANPRKIYIGKDCEQKYKNKLVEIGKNSNGKCEVYQMTYNEENFRFELYEEKCF